MGLFHFQEEAVGRCSGTPRASLWRTLEPTCAASSTPPATRRSRPRSCSTAALWEQSGHWDKYRENMFVAESRRDPVRGGRGHRPGALRSMALKPMNCPGHVQIFKQGIKSYRDLPLRMAEFGACHRNEPSRRAARADAGARQITQDDAHIFCTEDQIAARPGSSTSSAGSTGHRLRPTSHQVLDRPEQRAGSDATGTGRGGAGRGADRRRGYLRLRPGEGAFYGPKLEFVLTDAIGRDLAVRHLPARLRAARAAGCEYVGEDGARTAR
jgi:threonyl-tRNA synthetase